VCLGNPLADSGAIDAGEAGVTLLDTVTQQIVLETSANARGPGAWFLDGVRFIDDGTPSGAVVYSSFDAVTTNNSQLEKVLPDGGGWVKIRDTNVGGLGIGNDHKGTTILTAFSSTVGGPAAILRTLPDGGDGGPASDAGPAINMNHLAQGPKGDIYFTDARYQSLIGTDAGVYRMNSTGVVTTIESGKTTGAPEQNRFNGIVLSPDASKLYVSLTGTSQIRVYNVSIADGTVTIPVNDIFVAATGDAPAGMAVDVGGNLWVAEADINNAPNGRVEVFSPAGVKLGQITFAATRPTQVAFGGNNGTAVFITTEPQGGGPAAIYKYSGRCAGVK
jgi:hypothetical protein